MENNKMENIKSDFEKMPSCAEKLILKLIYDLYLNEHGQNQIDLEKLKKRLVIEELFSNSVKELYENLCRKFNRKDFDEASKQLANLLSTFRYINIPELLRLCKQNDASNEMINGKYIYLLLGLTGAGKSTTLHFLCGSKMENCIVNGMPHIGPVKINNSYLQAVTTSPKIQSETRVIIPVKIELEKNEDFVIFCDSPGFEDTNGPENDIANSIAIQKAIEICEGIKPIIVSSKLSGDRFERLSGLTHILSRMFKDLTKSVESFSYVYTKFSRSEEESLKKLLREY